MGLGAWAAGVFQLFAVTSLLVEQPLHPRQEALQNSCIRLRWAMASASQALGQVAASGDDAKWDLVVSTSLSLPLGMLRARLSGDLLHVSGS